MNKIMVWYKRRAETQVNQILHTGALVKGEEEAYQTYLTKRAKHLLYKELLILAGGIILWTIL